MLFSATFSSRTVNPSSDMNDVDLFTVLLHGINFSINKALHNRNKNVLDYRSNIRANGNT